MTAEKAVGARLRQHQVLRRVFADRSDGAPRPRHAAVRADEAGGPARSPDGTPALCGGAAPAGQPRRRSLQPRRVSDADQVERAGACAADDSGARARGVRPARHDSSQHLHQRPDGADRDVADADAAGSVLCRPGVRRGGLRRVGGLGSPGRAQRRSPCRGPCPARDAEDDRDGRAGLLRLTRGSGAITTRRTSRSGSCRRSTRRRRANRSVRWPRARARWRRWRSHGHEENEGAPQTSSLASCHEDHRQC